MEYFMLILIGGIISGLIGLFIGDLGNKNNSKSGALLGFFLGPIGWIITAVLPQTLSEEEKGKSAELQDLERKKIALLEAQLAELQKNSNQRNHSQHSKQYSEDPPVYHLD
jgi:hypothetical protein